MTPKDSPLLAVTMGDPGGVGPEVIVKALADLAPAGEFRALVLGDRGTLRRARRLFAPGLVIEEVEDAFESFRLAPGRVYLLPLSDLPEEDTVPGNPRRLHGAEVAGYVKRAARLCLEGRAAAVVTAPLSKETFARAGVPYPGHTELLAEACGARRYAMMLAGERLRVVLVTIHTALRRAVDLVTEENVLEKIELTDEALRRDLAVENPRIAVAGLNPHAGEAGIMGAEERVVIAPAVNRARAAGIEASGPFPPDTLFYRAASGEFDAVVCMYHDQGLIPLKLLHFDDGVNVTLGLPIVRTSVDHGTAYDIAWRGEASPESMKAALELAAFMARRRSKSAEDSSLSINSKLRHPRKSGGP